MVKQKMYKPEEIVNLLQRVEVAVANGRTTEQASRVGRETIRILLQSHELKPWRGKKLVHRGLE